MGNPLDENNREQLANSQMLDERVKERRALGMAKLIAKYRDSTFINNHFTKQKFVKIGESGMPAQKLEENVWSVWKYGLCLLPNGGRDNVMRVSLHINYTDIQLPFYVDLEPLDAQYCVVNPNYVQSGTAGRSALYKKMKAQKLKEMMKNGQDQQIKKLLTEKCPQLLQNLTRCSYLKHARERESDPEPESS